MKKPNEDTQWHTMSINKSMRASRFNQRPAIIWLTGLSGAGKSTTANVLEVELFSRGYHTYLLDGDNIRHGLCADLGFNDRDRAENIRRVGEVGRLMVDAGHIVITSFISPFLRERQMVRKMVAPGEFIEVYINTPLEVCEKRDPKGLYEKARQGRIKYFTGIDSPYEAPEDAEININTEKLSIKQAVDKIISSLIDYNIIDR